MDAPKLSSPRDRTHDRIYRVTYEGRPLLKPVKVAGEPVEKLLDLLKEPEDRVRYRARIELSARRHGEEVVIAVTDSGSGIPAADIGHIFDRFTRVGKGRSRDTGGFGLGLLQKFADRLVWRPEGEWNVVTLALRPQPG